MAFFDFLNKDPKPSSRQQAVERLRLIIESDSQLSRRLSTDDISQMKMEVLNVVRRYIQSVNVDDVSVSVRTEDNKEMLEMNINLHD